MSQSTFSLIEEVNYEWMKDADRYANESAFGRWGWFVDIAEVSFTLPFHRTLLGFDHTYFVLDLDPEIVSHPDIEILNHDPVKYREICIRGLIDFARGFLDECEHDFFAKLSGSGIHLIQRVPERINKRRFKSVVRYLCKPCSQYDEEGHTCDHTCDGWNFKREWSDLRNKWVKNNKQWTKIYYHEGTGATIAISIDMGMFQSGRHMIRWTYSRNTKIPQLNNYAIPIDYWNADWILGNMTRTGLSRYPPHHYEIPEFSLYSQLVPEGQLRDPIFDEEDTDYYGTRDLTYTIDVPDVDAKLSQNQLMKISNMRDLLTGSIEETPPCMKMHYQNVMELSGQHWPRVAIVRYLSGKGYNPDDIALFFRFHLNDERDNLPENRDKLFPGVKEAYGPLENPDMVPGCRKMRHHEYFGIIDDIDTCNQCGRSYPLASYSSISKVVKEEKDHGWELIQTLCRDILLGGESSLIKKATRAGVTTSMIAMSKLVNKKMLVVTPTNRIGEKTIPNALKIAKESLGIDIKGAMFAANKKACLKLVLLHNDLLHQKREDPDWGDSGRRVAFDKLHYNNRPDCRDCIFNRTHFERLRHKGNDKDSYPVPILGAEAHNWEPEITEEEVDGNCAYVTLRDYLWDIDVVFTTYSKLAALMQNNTEDAQFIRDMMADHFDVVLLDEVSYLTNQSPLAVSILQRSTKLSENDSDTREFSVNIFNDLNREIVDIRNRFHSQTANDLVSFLREFMDSQSHILGLPPEEYYTDRGENPIPDIQERLDRNFTAFHSIIESCAKEHNIHLQKTEDVIHLLKAENWITVSVPTMFHPTDVTIVAEPDVSYIRRFLRFFNVDGNQILVTDATLPYVSVQGFLGIQLKDTEIGDPRSTNDQQLVVTDSRRLSVIDLFFSEKNNQIQNELLSFINMVCTEHNPEDVIIIVPNKWTNAKLREYMIDGRIPTCKMTWYRSDKTIGVECDQRVMICITAPYPPMGSHDWLAMWYHEQGLLVTEDVEGLGKKLLINSTKAAFYQTIGRAKDPACEVRSTVYLWGIAGRKMLAEGFDPGAADLMSFDKTNIPLPHISVTSREESRGYLAVKMGKAWKEHQVQLSVDQTRLFGKVYNEGSFDTRETTRKFSFYSRKEVEKIIKETDPKIFDMFDINVKQFMSINRTYWVLERRKEN